MLYAFEILSLTTFVIACLFLRLFGININWSTVQFTFLEGVLPFACYMIAGIGLQFLFRKLRKQPLRDYWNAIRTRPWLLLSGRILLSTLLMFYSYTWIKLAIPLIHWSNLDPQLWKLDQTLHGGISPSLFATGLFTNPLFLRFLDYLYALWLPVVLAGQGFFSVDLQNEFRARFFFSIIAVWMVGVWIYVAVPALGPVYIWPQVFREVHASMPLQADTQRVLGANYAKVVESRKTGRIKAPFNPSYGVAAMPSLHVAMMMLLFLWARKWHSVMAFFFAVIGVLIFIGSIVSGWHYAIDGYAGALLAWGVYCAALIRSVRQGPRAETPAPQDEGKGAL